MTSRATSAPLLIVAGAYAVLGPSRTLGLGLVGLFCVTALWPRRLEVGRASQILLTMMLLAVGIALGTSLFAPAPSVAPGMLKLGWSVTVLTLLLVSAGRLWVARPLGGEPTTLLLALLAAAACGGTVSGALYPTTIAAVLLTTAWARRRADPVGVVGSVWAWRPMVALAAAALVALSAAVAADVTLPRVHGWVVQQILRGMGPRTGFSTRMSLGSVSGLWESDEVVLRVRGAETDYLRGAVFVTYDSGRWTAAADESARVRRTELPRTLPDGASQTEIEIVGREPEHYFLPLGAGEVAVPTGLALVDPDGLFVPLSAAPSTLYSYRTARGAHLAPLAAPGPESLAVEAGLARQLRPLALEWTDNAAGPAAQLAAIAERLRSDYQYSLDVEPPVGDPVRHFLLRAREGHCEYFASAMAMLGRVLGIPTRVVAGYRVVERNELGGHFVVRERNAHAWVEAWIDSLGWQPYDPTPPGALDSTMPTRTPLLGALWDMAGAGWAAGLRWLDRRTPLEIAGALLALVLFGAGLRVARALRERRRGFGGSVGEGPPAWFEAFGQSLAHHGIERADHEPVEAVALRLDGRGLPAGLADEIRRFVRGYAAFRYGGLGDGARLADSARRIVRRLGAHRTRGGTFR